MWRTKQGLISLVVLLGLGAGMAVAGPEISGRTPPADPRVYGKTFGEWSAEWWNWVLQFPIKTNPLFAEGDTDCSMGQSGSVWFLAGNFGWTSERSCTVQSGKALFFPVMNTLWWASEDAAEECGECEIGSDPADCPEECETALRAIAFELTDPAENMSCTVDDVPCVYSHLSVRTQSPAFVLSGPEGGLLEDFGFEPGDRPVAITDGFWVILPPLSGGEHEIHFHSENPDFEFVLDVTYLLTVE